VRTVARGSGTRDAKRSGSVLYRSNKPSLSPTIIAVSDIVQELRQEKEMVSDSWPGREGGREVSKQVGAAYLIESQY
jgi:hypothetical protein